MSSTNIEWSGTFANDNEQIEDIVTEIESIVNQISTKFDNAKTYWVDDHDPKGIELKKEAQLRFEEINTALANIRTAKEGLFQELFEAMENTNG